jgi:AcrR family transcriptional regulator
MSSGPDRVPKFSRKDPRVRRQLLIDAAIACLAEGGIAGFTIDKICRKAGISRGLVSHHFDGKDDLLAQAYEAMTHHLADAAETSLAMAATHPAAALRTVIEENLSATFLDRTELKAWLALWGEAAGNPELLKLHRKRYGAYHRGLATAIAALADERRRDVDAAALATTLIALIDGLWLEWCLDPTLLSAQAAKRACYALLEPHLGSISS